MPTAEDRKNVEFLAAIGTKEDVIARLVWNPRTGSQIAPTTLRRHFRQELDRAHAKADANVAQGLYKNATTATATYPGGIPVAQIFWLKTRAHWRQPPKDEPLPSTPLTDENAHLNFEEQRDAARRLAYLLELGVPEPKTRKAKNTA